MKMTKITTFDSKFVVWWALSSNSMCSWWAHQEHVLLELRAHQKHALLELRTQQTAHFESKVVILAIFIRITVKTVKLLYS